MLSACYQVVVGREPHTLRAYLLAVLVQLFAVNALAELGILQAAIVPFFGVLTLLGGFVFGLGMTLAVGCIGAVFTRAGEGKLDYALAAVAFALSAWVSNNWLVAPLRAWIGDVTALSLHRAFDLDRWVVIAMVIVVALLWVMRGKREAIDGGWNWIVTGCALGAVCTLAWFASSFVGRPYGIGTVQGSDNLASLLIERDVSAMNWNLFVVVGIPLGSLIATRSHGESIKRQFSYERLGPAFVGGLMLGFGAALAAGDNVLHGLSGVPVLAVSSLAFMVCMFLGVWLGVRLGWL